MFVVFVQCPDSGQVTGMCTDEDIFHHAKLACSRFKGEPFSECHQTVSFISILFIILIFMVYMYKNGTINGYASFHSN